MAESDGQTTNELGNGVNSEVGPEPLSNFRLIVLAALRSKQLLNGSKPRIEVDPLRRRSTTIAVEEVKRGLVPFRIRSLDQMTRAKAAVDRYDRPWGNARV